MTRRDRHQDLRLRRRADAGLGDHAGVRDRLAGVHVAGAGEGAVRSTHQTDIFSLGVVMYQLLTGRLPFQGTNNYSMIYQIINVDPPRPPPAASGSAAAHRRHRDARAGEGRRRALPDLGRVRARSGGRARAASTSSRRASPRARNSTPCASSISSASSPTSSCGRCCGWRRGTSRAGRPALIQEGDIGSSFFILVSGQVKVVEAGQAAEPPEGRRVLRRDGLSPRKPNERTPT